MAPRPRRRETARRDREAWTTAGNFLVSPPSSAWIVRHEVHALTRLGAQDEAVRHHERRPFNVLEGVPGKKRCALAHTAPAPAAPAPLCIAAASREGGSPARVSDREKDSRTHQRVEGARAWQPGRGHLLQL